MGPDHPVMRKRPELLEAADYWYGTFHELTYSRPSGMGGIEAPPITEIEAYCRIASIRNPWEFFRMMRRIDLAYMNAVQGRSTITLPQPGKG